MSGGWIGFDLDGTLAKHCDDISEGQIGDPIPSMVELLQDFVRNGWEVRIFTARVDGGEVALAAGNPVGAFYRDTERIKVLITEWLLKHVGFPLQITNKKDYSMEYCIDDRAMQVIPDTGVLLMHENKELRDRLERMEQAFRDCQKIMRDQLTR